MSGNHQASGLRHQWHRESHGHRAAPHKAARAAEAEQVDIHTLHRDATSHPKNVFAWRALANALLEEGFADQAAAAWTTALQRNRGNLYFMVHKAEFHFAQGDDKATVATLNPAIMSIADRRVKIGKIHGAFEREHTEKALGLFLAAAGESNPLFRRAYENCMYHDDYVRICAIAKAAFDNPARERSALERAQEAGKVSRAFSRTPWGIDLRPLHR